MALWLQKLLRHLCCFPAVGEERVKNVKQGLLLSCAYSLIWEFMAHCNQHLDLRVYCSSICHSEGLLQLGNVGRLRSWGISLKRFTALTKRTKAIRKRLWPKNGSPSMHCCCFSLLFPKLYSHAAQLLFFVFFSISASAYVPIHANHMRLFFRCLPEAHKSFM